MQQTLSTSSPAAQKATPSAARWIRATVRIIYVAVLILAATAHGFLLQITGQLGTPVEAALWIQGWCRRFLHGMGIETTITGPIPGTASASGERPEAIVCNHLSYLDILVMASALPCIMVAKSEVRAWPIVGWLTARAGAVYVWRGGRRETYPIVNASMARACRSGVPVAFFPEGTTTDSSEILPFRRGLFHSVLAGNVAVRCAALKFEVPSDSGATVEEDICWVGDAALVPHVFRLLGLRGVRAHLHFGRTATGADRFTLSEDARGAVCDLLERHSEPGALRVASKVFEVSF